MATYRVKPGLHIDYDLTATQKGWKVEITVWQNGQVKNTFLSPRAFNDRSEAFQAMLSVRNAVQFHRGASVSALNKMLGVQS